MPKTTRDRSRPDRSTSYAQTAMTMLASGYSADDVVSLLDCGVRQKDTNPRTVNVELLRQMEFALGQGKG